MQVKAPVDFGVQMWGNQTMEPPMHATVDILPIVIASFVLFGTFLAALAYGQLVTRNIDKQK